MAGRRNPGLSIEGSLAAFDTLVNEVSSNRTTFQSNEDKSGTVGRHSDKGNNSTQSQSTVNAGLAAFDNLVSEFSSRR